MRGGAYSINEVQENFVGGGERGGEKENCRTKVFFMQQRFWDQTWNPDRSKASNPARSRFAVRSIASAPPSASASMLSGMFGSCRDIRRSAQPPSMTMRTPSYEGLAMVSPFARARSSNAVRTSFP